MQHLIVAKRQYLAAPHKNSCTPQKLSKFDDVITQNFRKPLYSSSKSFPCNTSRFHLFPTCRLTRFRGAPRPPESRLMLVGPHFAWNHHSSPTSHKQHNKTVAVTPTLGSLNSVNQHYNVIPDGSFLEGLRFLLWRLAAHFFFSFLDIWTPSSFCQCRPSNHLNRRCCLYSQGISHASLQPAHKNKPSI